MDAGSFELEYVLSSVEDLPVLAFVHGLSANLSQFTGQLKHFRNDYRVLLISLRGHGGSGYPHPPKRQDFTLLKMADDCERLLDRLKLPSVNWVGNSMGGLVGCELLRRSPTRLLSLATFGTTAELHYREAVVRFVTLAKELLIAIKGYSWLARTAAGASSRDQHVQAIIEGMIQAAAPAAVRYAHMNIADYDYTGVLRQAQIPLLLIRCEYDRNINRALSSTLRALRDHGSAQIAELPRAGHFANLDQPDEFNRILETWLAKNNSAYAAHTTVPAPVTT